MKKICFVFALIMFSVLSFPVIAQETSKEMPAQTTPKQSWYYVETSHTAAQCMAAMDELKNSKANLLSKMYMGCHHGNHTCYGFLSGGSEASVRGMLPESTKKSAKIVPVDKFTAAEIEAGHKK